MSAQQTVGLRVEIGLYRELVCALLLRCGQIERKAMLGASTKGEITEGKILVSKRPEDIKSIFFFFL